MKQTDSSPPDFFKETALQPVTDKDSLDIYVADTMTGFETNFKGKTIHASVDEGMVYVNISYCRGFLTLHIRGYNETEFIKWYSGNIDDVDEVIIKVVDVAQNSESERISKDLSNYRILKQTLEKEGLI
ncbi:MAG: hypothetical protein LBL13_13185 [Bacteroidales bacterium]|jgi:hypothetical protein|nr:hypothetical protein [Bacteroidales bacterium]